ncbi:hypothetical protein SUDANB21_06479 [Streptomyces sp. enrichment culture]
MRRQVTVWARRWGVPVLVVQLLGQMAVAMVTAAQPSAGWAARWKPTALTCRMTVLATR